MVVVREVNNDKLGIPDFIAHVNFNDTRLRDIPHVNEIIAKVISYSRFQDLLNKGFKFRIFELHGEETVVSSERPLLFHFILLPSVQTEIDVGKQRDGASCNRIFPDSSTKWVGN